MRYLRALALLVALLGLLVPVSSPAAAAGHRHGVVIQVSNNNPEAWDFTLLNISYIQVQPGNRHLPIEVVAFGPGIYMLTRNSEVRAGLRKAMQHGVHFVAGEASMKSRGLKRRDIYPGVTFVPLGIAEIIARQREGWSYLKP
ncbi:MAG: DsrE family protein [Gammaproteobacteria bacterium]|nr:DsrE family protein [Gammaproteobacteria bacterium]